MGKKKCIGVCICSLLVGAIAGGTLVKRVWLEKYRKQKAELIYTKEERELLYNWLQLREKGIRLTEYFVEKGYRSLAVLGMGREGCLFLKEIFREGEIAPAYGVEVDHLGAVHESLVVYRLGDDPLPSADCLIVCDFVQTKEKMGITESEFPGEIISLAQLINWLMEKHNVDHWQGLPM